MSELGQADVHKGKHTHTHTQKKKSKVVGNSCSTPRRDGGRGIARREETLSFELISPPSLSPSKKKKKVIASFLSRSQPFHGKGKKKKGMQLLTFI